MAYTPKVRVLLEDLGVLLVFGEGLSSNSGEEHPCGVEQIPHGVDPGGASI